MRFAPLKNASTGTLITQYSYGYDNAANRTSEQVGSATTTSIPNSVNEITSQSGPVPRNLYYDFNGSLTDDGLTRTFEWDAANRLVAINYTGTTNRSEFSYDGLSRCVKIVEKANGSVTSTRKFVWCGMEKCEFRDGGDVVTDYIYAQGQYTAGVKYFCTRDHLGSIREMFKNNGVVVARFDYDPWGRSTTVINTTPPDFNFTGLYRHSASNLDFAVYRAYDPELGRWLSRDPIDDAEMRQGPNLYTYVQNDAVNRIDPDGRQALDWIFKQILKRIVAPSITKKTDNQDSLGGPYIAPTRWQLIDEQKSTTNLCTCVKACIYFAWSGHYQDELGRPEARVLWIDCNIPCPRIPWGIHYTP